MSRVPPTAPRTGADRNRKRKGRSVIAAAVVLASAAGLLAVLGAAAPAQAAGDCRAGVDYTVAADWGSGFQAQVTVRNTGTAPIDGWAVTLRYPAPITVSSGWSVTGPIVIDPYTIRFTNPSWNAVIPSGGRTSFGFAASGGGGAPAITMTSGGEDCALDGAGPAVSSNPYEGADLYVDPEWSALAQAGGAPAEVYGQGTAVWLDSITAVEGAGGMGLAEHLDEALEQRASSPSGELVVQIVLYNLPGRDCAALRSTGELAPDEIDRYRYEFVDPIAAIIGRPEYADLRVTAVIEPFSLAYLPDHVSPHPGATPQCDEVMALGSYQEGIAYAAAALADVGVHNYLDTGGHSLLGWSDASPFYDTFGNAARLYATIFDHGAEPGDVQGIAVNTADYSPLEEPYFDADDVVSGVPVAQTHWVDFRDYVDETAFALDFRDRLVAEGFAADLGVVVDTSRNGWGGPDRPTQTSASTDPNTYVDESRTDRRLDQRHRCNQAGAGLGERPQADPVGDPRLHAYVWIKPPGESDGPHADNDQGFDRICTPEVGSLPNSPPAGEWFQAGFEQLLANAWPAL